MQLKPLKKTVTLPQQSVSGLGDNTTRVIVINEQIKKIEVHGFAGNVDGNGNFTPVQGIVVSKMGPDFDAAMKALESASSFSDGIDTLLKAQLAASIGVDPASL